MVRLAATAQCLGTLVSKPSLLVSENIFHLISCWIHGMLLGIISWPGNSMFLLFGIKVIWMLNIQQYWLQEKWVGVIWNLIFLCFQFMLWCVIFLHFFFHFLFVLCVYKDDGEAANLVECPSASDLPVYKLSLSLPGLGWRFWLLGLAWTKHWPYIPWPNLF